VAAGGAYFAAEDGPGPRPLARQVPHPPAAPSRGHGDRLMDSAGMRQASGAASAVGPRLMRINRRGDRAGGRSERKAERAACIEPGVETDLLARLQCGSYDAQVKVPVSRMVALLDRQEAAARVAPRLRAPPPRPATKVGVAEAAVATPAPAPPSRRRVRTLELELELEHER